MGLLEDEDTYRVNAFDWQAEFPEIMAGGGFDVVMVLRLICASKS